MSEVKWIKITTNMFEDEKIDFIESLPEADSLIVIWMKLLALAGKCNQNGYIMLTEKISYTDEMLAHKFRRPLNTVRLAIQTFTNLGMIVNEGIGLYITNWNKHQNIEGLDKIREQNRKRKQEQRLREKEQILLLSGDVSRDSHVTVTQSHETDVDKELDIEKDVVVITPEFFYNNNIGQINSHIAQEIKYLIEDDGVEEALIVRLMQEAVNNNKASWSYIKTAIKNNLNKNIKTLEAYDANENRRKNKPTTTAKPRKLIM